MTFENIYHNAHSSELLRHFTGQFWGFIMVTGIICFRYCFFKFLTFEMTFEHVNVSVTTGDM